jgi:hypothetical protein
MRSREAQRRAWRGLMGLGMSHLAAFAGLFLGYDSYITHMEELVAKRVRSREKG